jgi:hypothetical protein
MGAGAGNVLQGCQARMVVVLVMAFFHYGHYDGMFMAMPAMVMVMAVLVIVIVVMGLSAAMAVAILFPLAGQGQR